MELEPYIKDGDPCATLYNLSGQQEEDKLCVDDEWTVIDVQPSGTGHPRKETEKKKKCDEKRKMAYKRARQFYLKEIRKNASSGSRLRSINLIVYACFQNVDVSRVELRENFFFFFCPKKKISLETWDFSKFIFHFIFD